MLDKIKVGDEVLVRATVKEIDSDSFKPVALHAQGSTVDAETGYVMVSADAIVLPVRLWLGREHMRYCLWEVEPTYLGDEHGFNVPPENDQRGLLANLYPTVAERLFGVRLEMGQLCELDANFKVLECSGSANGGSP